MGGGGGGVEYQVSGWECPVSGDSGMGEEGGIHWEAEEVGGWRRGVSRTKILWNSLGGWWRQGELWRPCISGRWVGLKLDFWAAFILVSFWR